jgi:hypothetical protein
MNNITAAVQSGEMNMHDALDLETVTMSFWAPRAPKIIAEACRPKRSRDV